MSNKHVEEQVPYKIIAFQKDKGGEKRDGVDYDALYRWGGSEGVRNVFQPVVVLDTVSYVPVRSFQDDLLARPFVPQAVTLH